MSDANETILDAIRRRSAQRRDVLKYAAQTTVVAGGLTLLSACGDDDALFGTPNPPSPTPTPTPTATTTPPPPTPTGGFTETDYLNFALQMTYLKANFYGIAGNGAALTDADTTGTGTKGTVTGTGQVQVTFANADAPLTTFAKEHAAETLLHVRALRTALANSATAMPTINLGTAGTGGASSDAFSLFANAAKGTAGNFAPYTVNRAFLAAAAFINSEILLAYRGVSQHLTTSKYVTLMSGLVGAASYHTSAFRTYSYLRGAAADIPQGVGQIDPFAAYASNLDGSSPGTYDFKLVPPPAGDDQGVSAGRGDAAQGGGNSDAAANIVSADTNGLAFARSPDRTLNVLFVTKTATTSGGFFPSGINGTIVGSAAIA